MLVLLLGEVEGREGTAARARAIEVEPDRAEERQMDRRNT